MAHKIGIYYDEQGIREIMKVVAESEQEGNDNA